MNNIIIQLSRFVLIILLSGLTIMATAQVKTSTKTVSEKTTNSETTTTNQVEFQEPVGIVVPLSFVIEDDIMQSNDANGGNGNNKDKNIEVSLANNNTNKNTGFITSNLNQLAQEIEIYPIPANTFTNIDLGQVKVKNLEIVNSLGQKIYNQTIEQQLIRLDISNYQSGIYFIQITTTGNQVITKSIMVN